MKKWILVGLMAGLAGSLAQDGASDPRKRMIFRPGELGPEATPTATPTPGPVVRKVEPPAAVEAFFLGLQAGRVDAAYETLVRGTVIADRKEDVDQLKERTKRALDSYGLVAGYETLEVREAGTRLMRYTCISLNEDLPLRWRFYFYRGPEGWKLIDLRVDDGLAELFEKAD